MILEEMFNGRFYPCETVVADSPRFKQASQSQCRPDGHFIGASEQRGLCTG